MNKYENEQKEKLNKNDMGQKEELDWTCCKGRWSDEIGARRENEGMRPRGRPRMGMINDVLDETYGDMKRKAENRESRRILKQRTCPWLLRPRMGMIDDVLDETYGDMKRKAEN